MAGIKESLASIVCQISMAHRWEHFAELHVEYEDGSKDVIATDETWSVKTGEIRYSEIYMGETIDTDAPEITEGNVVVKEFDKAVLTAQENEPVRITEKIAGKS
mgnify:CR=1 FL=1